MGGCRGAGATATPDGDDHDDGGGGSNDGGGGGGDGAGGDPSVSPKRFYIFDARSVIAAQANRVKKKGVERASNYIATELVHCDIGNIHTMR